MFPQLPRSFTAPSYSSSSSSSTPQQLWGPWGPTITSSRGGPGAGKKPRGHTGKMQVPEPVPRRGSSDRPPCSRCAGKQGERSRQHAGARCCGSEPSCSAILEDIPSQLCFLLLCFRAAHGRGGSGPAGRGPWGQNRFSLLISAMMASVLKGTHSCAFHRPGQTLHGKG